MAREQCPVCSAGDHEELIALEEYPYGGNGAVRPEEANNVPYGTLSINFCRLCGALFQTEPVSIEELDEMLLRQPVPLPVNLTKLENVETDRFLNSLKRFVETRGNALDIGCGSGELMKRLTEIGFSVNGVEAHPEAVELAKKDHLEVQEGRFEEGMYPEDSFDLITARSILEHTIDPSTILATMVNLLKPGGYLAIEVPNIERILKRSAFGGFSFNHVQYWTPETLRYAIGIQGLEIMGMHEENYIGIFARKPEKGEEVEDPMPPSDEDVEALFEEVDRFLERKEDLAERLPETIQKRFPNGIVILGAGAPTVDLLYYSEIHDYVKGIVTSDKTRVGAVLAGTDFTIESLENISKLEFDCVMVSSERRQEELVELMASFRREGGRVLRFNPDIEIL